MRKILSGVLVAILVAANGCGSDSSTPSSAAPPSQAKASDSGASHSFYEVDIEGRTAILDLTPNDTLVSKSYREHVATGGGLVEMPGAKIPTCMYRGRASWADGGKSTGPAWSALNTCKGFEGMVAMDGETWILAQGSKDDEVLLSRMSEGLGARVTAAVIRRSAGPSTGAEGSVAEQAEALIPPSKYLGLVVVSDAARYEKLGMDALADTLAIANLADAIYRNGTLTPSVAIVVTDNIVIPGGTDPWPVPAVGEVNSADLLNDFKTWAGTHLPAGDEYALLTQRDMDGSTIGLAYISAACTKMNDAIIQATLVTQAQVGTVLAHELGHSLGMQHDTTGSPCGTGGPYIMDPIISAPPSTTWSSCSATALANYVASLPSPSCLDDVPAPYMSGVPHCGDGVRDPGEQCDCGSSDCGDFDPCCNGATCRLTDASECSAIDGCCNNCRIAGPGTLCKAAAQCTPAATCSGVSSACPKLAPLANGTACTVAAFTDGRCFEGDCQSRSAQCDALSSGATACSTDPSHDSSCDVLYCFLPSNGGCSFFVVGSDLTPARDGSTCGTSTQCYQGACTPSVAIPVCPNGMQPNACGGCSSLATAPGSVCNTCGITRCLTPSEVTCSVADASHCPSWVAGDYGACSANCAGATQTRTVACYLSGAVVPDAECASSGPKPATQQACPSQPCAVGEVCTPSGPGTSSCTDLNECTINNGACDPRVTCTNTSGGRICGALDACHPAYLCPAGTVCPVTTAADGTSCNTGYQCMAGACLPINACASSPCAVGEVCTSTGPGTFSCADFNECSITNGGCDGRVTCTNTSGGRICGALDACHPAYLCPAGTGPCPVTTAADGTSCSDQNRCTQTDVCRAGACVGSNAVVCTGAGRCQLPGSCNTSTGLCGAPVPDPSCAHCSDGIKNSGETGVDCGGSQCLACKGAACNSNTECASGLCKLAKGKQTSGTCLDGE